MSQFLDWHPSSDNAKRLHSQREEITNIVASDPSRGIALLKKHWQFGIVSEVWDDFIFENCIRPVLERNLNNNIKLAIRIYSAIDHLLFTTYIRREENPVRFRRAFWNVNFYGKLLSTRLISELPKKCKHEISNTSAKKIAFILKGPYRLAHVEFLHSFLNGSNIFCDKVKIFLILLDDKKSAPVRINHIEIISFSSIRDPYEKLKTYIDFCNEQQFDHICWVACVQNLAMYMGLQLAPVQSYWSMKYHSIVMPTIQKYAGLGFGGDNFNFDDTEWYRGRAFPDLQMPNRDSRLINKLRSSCNLSEDSLLVGCFVRSEKLHDQLFWDSILEILNSSPNVHFAIASQDIPQGLLEYISGLSASSQARFHKLGWVNTKEWAFALDIYYDSSPRGSCNTIFEAIEADVPVLLADSEHNRESSALPYLTSANKALGLTTTIPGVFSNEADRLNACLKLLSDSSLRHQLASDQNKLLLNLKGHQYLFAKDYLNFFLDESLTLARKV